jgi:hypothetical protein
MSTMQFQPAAPEPGETVNLFIPPNTKSPLVLKIHMGTWEET